jgi:hypothetical protein
MGFCSSFLMLVALALVTPAYGALVFTLDSDVGSGSPTNLPADPDTCLAPNCVLFTGTLDDTDTDSSIMLIGYTPDGISPVITVTFFSSPAAGSLSLDNTFYEDVPGVLSGDPTWATDGSGNPPNIYGDNEPIFGIDIAPGTSSGVYNGEVTIYAAGGTGDQDYNGFSVTQDFTVNVTPEPSTVSLSLVGLAAFTGSRRIKRKWRPSQARLR